MKQITLLIFLLFSLTFLKGQVTVDSDNENISYWGRVDHSDPKSPTFEYAGVTIRASFTGTSISAKLNDFASHTATTTNYFYKIIDGGAPEKFEALSGRNTYELASSLSEGNHSIELIKITEAMVGRTAFEGFILDSGASLLPTVEPECTIEFIGNSITSGYGNEASIPSNPNTGFTSVNENNYKAWGYVTARNLGMAYRAVSYSGRGMYRNNTGSTNGTLPKIYDRIFPDASNSPIWDHTANHPDVVVINLGTNDFALDPGTPLDEELYKSTYVDFIETLKGYHPNALIVCAVGTMITDAYPQGAQHWTRIRNYVQDVVSTVNGNGYDDVFYFAMDPQTAPYGEDWHPTAATHTSMANSLTDFINSKTYTCGNSSGGFSYQIAPWFDNKSAAVALTYDDFTPGQPGIAVPEMESRGMVGTFFVNTSVGQNWGAMAAAYDKGNEIANHSETHPDLTTLTTSQLSDEIRGAKETIEANINGVKVLTYAYPFGTLNTEVVDSLQASGHIASRGVKPSSQNYTYDFAPEEDDYFDILTFGMDENVTLSSFEGQLNNIENGGGLLTLLYHAISSPEVVDNGYAEIPVDNYTAQLDALKSRENSIWISTFAQAIQYHKERKSAFLEVVSEPFVDGDTWKLSLRDELPDDCFFQALTVSVSLPSEVNNIVSVQQAGQQLIFTVSGNELQFNAVPDGGEIIINLSDCTPPEINFNLEQVEFCTPDSALVYSDHEEGNTYEWFLDGVLVNGNSDSSLYITEAGEYTLNVTNDGCTARSSTLGLSVNGVVTGICGEPRADFEADKVSIIVNEEVVFTSLSENVEPGASFEWRFSEEVSFPDAGTSGTTFVGEGPVTVVFLNEGEVEVELWVSGSAVNDSTSKAFDVLGDIGCILEDHFDVASSINLVGGWNTFSTNIDNSNLAVTNTASVANEWHSFTFQFNEDGNALPMDFSQAPRKPVIRFRARATDTCVVTVSVVDQGGVIAGGSVLGTKNNFTVTSAYQLFELDMSGLFFNQWDGVDLDSTAISAIDFRMNSGYESFPITDDFGLVRNAPFEGTLEIDWIGVNDACIAPDFVSSIFDGGAGKQVKVYPNPTSGMIFTEIGTVQVFNAQGVPVFEGWSDGRVDLSYLDSGIYNIIVDNQQEKVSLQK